MEENHWKNRPQSCTYNVYICLRSRPVSPNVVRPLVSDNVENLSDWVTGSFADDWPYGIFTYLDGGAGNHDRSHVSNGAAQVSLVVGAAVLVFEHTKFCGEEDSPAAFWPSGLVVKMPFAAVGLVSDQLVHIVKVLDVFTRWGKISTTTRRHFISLISEKNIKN